VCVESSWAEQSEIVALVKRSILTVDAISMQKYTINCLNRMLSQYGKLSALIKLLVLIESASNNMAEAKKVHDAGNVNATMDDANVTHLFNNLHSRANSPSKKAKNPTETPKKYVDPKYNSAGGFLLQNHT
jgi:hypothetical protein